MGETFSSLRSPSLVERVRQAIKSHIADASLKPGDPLPPETHMARELGVSRSAVREAVKSLEAAGLVEVRRGNGLFVGKFSFDTLLANLPYGLMQPDGTPLHELLEIRKVVTVQGGAPEIPVERAATEWEVAALGLMAQGPAADAAGIHGPSPNSWRNACSRLTPCLAAVDR